MIILEELDTKLQELFYWLYWNDKKNTFPTREQITDRLEDINNLIISARIEFNEELKKTLEVSK